MTNFHRRVFGICAVAALLTACGALRQAQDDMQPPVSAPGAMPQSSAIAAHAAGDRSWMLPEVKNEDLLYVSNWYPANKVTVYSYEHRTLVGTLTGFSFPAGLCADKAGNVFVANEDGNDILEYVHGGTKPIESLPDSDGAIACSVDPTTGNLAVANAGYVGGPPGSLYVYKNASATPTKYTDGYYLDHFFSCVYDGQGNLFADGSNGASSGVALAELPKGSNTLTNLRLSPKPRSLALPGGLGWDGKYVTLYIGSRHNVIDRLTIKGNQARRHHYTFLERGQPDNGYLIVFDPRRHRQIVVAADNIHGRVWYWNYPAGGIPIASVRKAVDDPVGATVSLAPH